MSEPRKFPLGKRFYDELRIKFRSEDSPQKKLQKMAPETCEINNTLLLAMAEYTCKRKRAPMLSYLSTCETMSRVEFQGVL